MTRLDLSAAWDPPAGWARIRTIEAHAAGEPLRIVVGGCPIPEGGTILDRRRAMQARFDRFRRALVFEPRGHFDMYAALLMPPATPDGDVGVLFMHNEGFSTMCGHGVIALGRVLVETGMLAATEPVTTIRMDTPAGRVTASVAVAGGAVSRVSFENVPSFVEAADRSVEVPGLGRVRYDLAFGGAYYAYVDAAAIGLPLEGGQIGRIVEQGMAIKRAVAAAAPIRHPVEPDLGFLYGTIFFDRAQAAGAHSRHVCVYADGAVDRSPTGTGVSGRIAILRHRGAIGLGEPVTIESITGRTFAGRAVATAACGDRPAVVPEVSGTAHITGRSEFLIDPADPLGFGFLLR